MIELLVFAIALPIIVLMIFNWQWVIILLAAAMLLGRWEWVAPLAAVLVIHLAVRSIRWIIAPLWWPADSKR